MDLTDKQFKDFHRLLLTAFPTRAALARMVRFELGQQLDVLTTSSSLSDTVFELIQWAQSHDADLLQAAIAANPDHKGLRTFAAQVTGTSSPIGSSPAPASSLTWQARRDLRKLLIATYTTEAQVRELCLDFGIPYRQLEGEDLSSRIASLLAIAERQGQAVDLAAAAREEAERQAAVARQAQEQQAQAARENRLAELGSILTDDNRRSQVTDLAAGAEADQQAASQMAARQAQEAARWEEAAQQSLSPIHSS